MMEAGTLFYVVLPTILLLVVLASVWLDRWSVPVILLALGGGILFGKDVLSVWSFDNQELTSRCANLALVFILFQGGFGTKRSDLKAVGLAATGMATWGVLLTAAVGFLALWKGLGWDPERALLLSAIISSTDAAATFSILKRQALPKRLASTLEIESAANDPMAVVLTTVVVGAFASGETEGWWMVPSFLWQFVGGPLIGYGAGWGAVRLFNWLRPTERGHYYVLFLAVVLLTYGVADLAQTSGMLAVFVAGLHMGNHAFVHKQGVSNFSLAFSSIANIGMFVMLGLLVSPKAMLGIARDGLALFGVLALVSRPAAVLLGTAGMGFRWKDKLFMSWAGLRGAVPIVLATYPAAAGLEDSGTVFNLVFFAVLLSVLVQGSTLGTLGRWLHFPARTGSDPLYSLELFTMEKSDKDLLTVDLPGEAEGPRIMDLRLPPETVITLISRGAEVVSPMGQTRLRGGDRVTVLVSQERMGEAEAALVGAVSGVANDE